MNLSDKGVMELLTIAKKRGLSAEAVFAGVAEGEEKEKMTFIYDNIK